MGKCVYHREAIEQFFRDKLLGYVRLEKERRSREINLSEKEMSDRITKSTNAILVMLDENDNKLTYKMLYMAYEILFEGYDPDFASNVKCL